MTSTIETRLRSVADDGIGAPLHRDVHAGTARPRPRSPLDALFAPRSVAVIGASETPRSVGRSVFENMCAGFDGQVAPVNSRRGSVLGMAAYPTVSDVPFPVDLAVIATPAPTTPEIIRQCGKAGVQAAVVLSAGFGEFGPDGAARERELLAAARDGGVRIVGPNCLGVMNPRVGLNASFAATIARPGSVGFISQSGALCTAVLDWSLSAAVGFSVFASIGSSADLGWPDLIDYLADDPATKSILLYIESIGDARAFLSAAREVALAKPVIALKAGRTSAGARAAASHTGALAGSDEVLDAAFRRCGVLRVDTIADLFYMAETLSTQPRPAGRRLTVVTNAGGPGVLATDALMASGAALAKPSAETIEALNGVLPAAWSHGNPVDILGDADPERYARAIEIIGKDTESDGMLVVLTPQSMTDPEQTAACLASRPRTASKPLLASWMGGPSVEQGRNRLKDAGIPVFQFPDTAARMFAHMWHSAADLRALYETPEPSWDEQRTSEARSAVAGMIAAARASGRSILTEAESKQIISAYDIPTVQTCVATTAEEAATAAAAIGFPVVVKLHSHTVTHKSDVGGVRVNLPDAAAVINAFQDVERAVTSKIGPSAFGGVTVQPMVLRQGIELIVGSSADSQFGPVLLFGAGGKLVEVMGDRALALPPLNTTLARRAIERTRIYQALQGVRGERGVDLDALDRLLVRFSELAVDHPAIKEIDINPLVATAEGMMALDARVILHGSEAEEALALRPAIRPYPSRYVSSWRMADGSDVLIRPIRPEDERFMARFHETLSDETVYLRYFQHLNLGQRVAHERLVRMCFVDYDRQIALVAVRPDQANGAEEIVAVARLIRRRGTTEAEFALVVADGCQQRGLGTELVRRTIEVARAEGISALHADILAANINMRRICLNLGCTIIPTREEQLVRAELRLS